MPQSNFPWRGKGEADELPIATPTQQGVVHQAAHQAHSVAADVPALLVDFNLLLDKLVAAGLMSAT